MDSTSSSEEGKLQRMMAWAAGDSAHAAMNATCPCEKTLALKNVETEEHSPQGVQPILHKDTASMVTKGFDHDAEALKLQLQCAAQREAALLLSQAIAERKAKRLSTELDNLKGEKTATAEVENQKLQEQLKMVNGRAGSFKIEVEEVQAQLESCRFHCKQKEKKLTAAMQEVQQLQDDMQALGLQYEEDWGSRVQDVSAQMDAMRTLLLLLCDDVLEASCLSGLANVQQTSSKDWKQVIQELKSSDQKDLDDFTEDRSLRCEEAERKASLYAVQLGDAVLELEKARGECEARGRELQCKATELATSNERVREMAAEFDSLDARNSSLEGSIADLEQLLSKERQEARETECLFSEAKGKIEALESRLVALEHALDSQQLEAKTAADCVQAKDDRIKEMRAALTLLTEDQGRLELELRRQLDATKSALEQAEHRQEKDAQQLCKLFQDLENSQHRIDVLNTKASEAERVQRQSEEKAEKLQNVLCMLCNQERTPLQRSHRSPRNSLRFSPSAVQTIICAEFRRV
ncbi:unnamed protein product [Ostreobium quekettii]|uniref:Uncharacterized protein n=1 Tax=Ostreobium quekettii TaxID=121088 RepID=A0A8S1J5X4_9CHLO|nr:unnamed protein product [Ostreobium quekettii]